MTATQTVGCFASPTRGFPNGGRAECNGTASASPNPVYGWLKTSSQSTARTAATPRGSETSGPRAHGAADSTSATARHTSRDSRATRSDRERFAAPLVEIAVADFTAVGLPALDVGVRHLLHELGKISVVPE